MSVTTVPIRPIQKGSLTKLWIGLGLVLAVAAAFAWFGTARVVCENGDNEMFLACNAAEGGVIKTESGLQYQVIKAGEGPSPTATDTALVKYKGTLRDGSVFDENEQTPMAVGGVVPGFSEALQLMQEGGEYRIWIPSELGYGEVSPGPDLPANSILIFDVTLIDFISAEQMQQLQQQMQQQGGPPAGIPRP